jgi:hypothetical protein
MAAKLALQENVLAKQARQVADLEALLSLKAAAEGDVEAAVRASLQAAETRRAAAPAFISDPKDFTRRALFKLQAAVSQ